MLVEHTLDGIKDKVQIAIERLQQFEPEEGYYLAFSGGKDSLIIYHLAKMAEINFDSHYNNTSIDPPEIINFIKTYYPGVEIHKPKIPMFRLIPQKLMPPTRIVRYCCDVLKEQGGEGRFVITGVRAEESIKRRNRKMVDFCYKSNKRIINPIIDWTEKDVWNFIKTQGLKYCSLYDEGYKRIGCIMCPLQNRSGILRDKERYPKFYNAYLLAFKKMLEERKMRGKETRWNSPEEVMKWWIYGNPKKIQEENLFDTTLDRFHYE